MVASEERQTPARQSTLVIAADLPERMAGAGRGPRAAQVVFDLADLDPSRKDVAREAVISALEADDHGEALVAVRVNPIGTMWAYRDVVDVVERVGEFVDGIVVPRVTAPGDVEFVDTLLGMIEQRIDLAHRIDIDAEIAGAQALMLLDEIALASERLEALVLDEAAVVTALGATDDAGAALAAVRVRVLTVARAVGVEAVVAPAEPADDAAYRDAIASAAALGFDGARATHPGRVKAVNAVFPPSPTGRSGRRN